MTSVFMTTPNIKLKNIMACIIEKTKAKKNSFSFALINLSGCLSKII